MQQYLKKIEIKMLNKFIITHFRNLIDVTFTPLQKGVNLIYGNNGSGKTSVLEAIYYLSRARSFRSSTAGRVINHAAESFTIFAELATSCGQITSIGIERQLSGALQMRIAGQENRHVAELASLLPVQIINSNCYNLLDAGPIFRRHYLDWGGFYFSTQFLPAWRNYERTLKQRNAALRDKLPRKELDSWTQKLITHAATLDSLRRDYVEHLLPLLKQNMQTMLPRETLELRYFPGWDETTNYAAILEDSFGKDMYLGHTQFGPHRADLKVTINHIPAKDILSRGQQKLFVCGMIFAQGTLLEKHTTLRPIYLVDDLPAELDLTSRSNLMQLLLSQEAQVFITAIEEDILNPLLTQVPHKMFHVEHGNLTETNCGVITA